jgi:ribose 5-phosphate isomerase A
MGQDLSPVDRAKKAAADHAASFVEDGMKVGLGTGSTAAWLVRRLGERHRDEGLQITAVATSSQTEALAREVGLATSTLDDAGWLDLTIDGADEFDGSFSLIKGAGGALLQEKVVAMASDRMIVIADPSKDVAQLGAFPLSIEVLEFGRQSTTTLIERALDDLGMAGREITLRMAGESPFVTDEGNRILDLHLKSIRNAAALSVALNQVPGVVENGLFVGIADTVVIGHEDGSTELRRLG